jgi:hypothetical protein
MLERTTGLGVWSRKLGSGTSAQGSRILDVFEARGGGGRGRARAARATGAQCGLGVVEASPAV